MFAEFHKKFKKRYKKLRKGERKKRDARITLFVRDPFHPLLNNHPLSGPYEGCRSINIAGDLRALYEHRPGNVAYFMILGTHHELFGS